MKQISIIFAAVIALSTSVQAGVDVTSVKVSIKSARGDCSPIGDQLNRALELYLKAHDRGNSHAIKRAERAIDLFEKHLKKCMKNKKTPDYDVGGSVTFN